MKKNQNGFSAVEVLVVLVIIGLIGTVGWLVYDRQQSKSSKNENSTNSSSTKPAELNGNVGFSNINELSGWSEEHQQGSSIYSLMNDQLGCYVSVGVEKPKIDLSGVEPLAGTPNREVTLGSGQKVTVYESGKSKDYTVSEGHIIKDDFNANVIVACKDRANYASADAALKGIKLE